MSRSVLHLAPSDGLLEAAARVRRASGEGDLVVVVPEAAPFLLDPLFLAAARDERAERPFVLVTADDRARAMASGCRIPAYASLAAYEERSVDPTEDLEGARATALAAIPRGRRAARPRSLRAVLVAAVALLVATLLLVPSAEVVVATEAIPLGPVQLDVRTQPAGSVPAQALAAQISVKAQGTATGSRTETTKATGMERFTNASLDTVTIPAGTVVWTSSNVQFKTTEGRTMGPSSIIPPSISTTDIPIEAASAGLAGDVPRGTITNVADRRLRVTNDVPTGGGDEKKITFVQASDVATAASLLDQALQTAARQQVVKWRSAASDGRHVEDGFALRGKVTTDANAFLSQQVSAFELSASAEVVGFSIPDGEPRATASRQLLESLRDGYEVVPESDTYPFTTTVTADGVVWHVVASGTQRPRMDQAGLQLALWAQEPARAPAILDARGLRLLAIRSFPEWWPRLPLVPLRISVRTGSVAASR